MTPPAGAAYLDEENIYFRGRFGIKLNKTPEQPPVERSPLDHEVETPCPDILPDVVRRCG